MGLETWNIVLDYLLFHDYDVKTNTLLNRINQLVWKLISLFVGCFLIVSDSVFVCFHCVCGRVSVSDRVLNTAQHLTGKAGRAHDRLQRSWFIWQALHSLHPVRRLSAANDVWHQRTAFPASAVSGDFCSSRVSWGADWWAAWCQNSKTDAQLCRKCYSYPGCILFLLSDCFVLEAWSLIWSTLQFGPSAIFCSLYGFLWIKIELNRRR